MKLVVNALLVAGFCLGTVGAAGLHDPASSAKGAAAKLEEGTAWAEPYALFLFLGGVVIVIAGGLVSRLTKDTEDEEGAGAGAGLGAARSLVNQIRDKVVELDEQKGSLSGDEVRRRIDDLLAGEYFDLTSQNEELMTRMGFANYVRVWEGVATAERLLARTWSMATDDHLEQGLLELPAARRHIEHAAKAFEQLDGRP